MKKVILGLFVALFALVLVGCAPKDSSAAKQKMEKAGYTVVATVYDEVQEDGSVASLACTKGNTIGSIIDGLGNGLTAVLYDSTKNAKAAYNSSKNAEGKSNYTLVGKWVVWGSEEAVKAFK